MIQQKCVVIIVNTIDFIWPILELCLPWYSPKRQAMVNDHVATLWEGHWLNHISLNIQEQTCPQSLQLETWSRVVDKHKENSPTPEKERRKEQDISLQMNIDEMAEALYSPPQPNAEDLTGIQVVKETENTSFQCEQCNNESSSASIIQSHIDFKHNSNVPHISKWHPNNCHICNTQLSTHSHMENVRNFTRAGLFISRFYPKVRESLQFQNLDKTA